MANTGTESRDKAPGPGKTIKSLCPFASAMYQASLCLANFFHMLLSITEAAFMAGWGDGREPSIVIETIAICATFV